MTWLTNILSLILMQNIQVLVSGHITVTIPSRFADDELLQPLYDSGIVPDVISGIPPDGDILEASVIFSDTLELVSPGQTLSPTQVKDAPIINYDFWAGDHPPLYTVMMVDPDAPSGENSGNNSGVWLHWLVANIPENKLESGDTLAEYVGAGPPLNSTAHRYVLLVYYQGLIEYHNALPIKLNNKSVYMRSNFSVDKFAETYGLELHAVNFFYSTYDDYVPILYKQLGIGSNGIGLGPTNAVLFTVLLGFIVNKIFH